MFDFSIIAPVYPMKKGSQFLVEYLSSLVQQTHKNFEVIVTDQSIGNHEYLEICNTFSHVLNVRHVFNHGPLKSAAANVNHGIRHAKGNLVKLLYVDDFFVDNHALEKIHQSFVYNPEGKWFLSGFVCCNEDKTSFYNARTPWYGNAFVNGDNVTGNPSNYTVRRECALEMDENLLWIVDGEYFYRSYYHYGNPIMINDILVCFRDHGESAFKRPDLSELDARERQYCVEKYSRKVEQKLI